MGYRLTINYKEGIYALGRLYGYNNCDLKNAKGIEWLFQNKFIRNKEVFENGEDVRVVLLGYEAKEFLELYKKDINLIENFKFVDDVRKNIDEFLKTIKESSFYIFRWI